MNRYINITHIKKYTDGKTADSIIRKASKTIGTEHIECVTKYQVAEKTAYARKSLRHFKIDDAIEKLQSTYKDNDEIGSKYIAPLLKIREDIVEYGTKIPNSSDTWEEKWREPYLKKRTKEDESRLREARVSEKKKNRKKFIDKFNEVFNKEK